MLKVQRAPNARGGMVCVQEGKKSRAIASQALSGLSFLLPHQSPGADFCAAVGEGKEGQGLLASTGRISMCFPWHSRPPG